MLNSKKFLLPFYLVLFSKQRSIVYLNIRSFPLLFIIYIKFKYKEFGISSKLVWFFFPCISSIDPFIPWNPFQPKFIMTTWLFSTATKYWLTINWLYSTWMAIYFSWELTSSRQSLILFLYSWQQIWI